MAIAVSELTTGADTVDRSAYTTASVTLGSGKFYLLAEAHRNGVVPSTVATTGGAISFALVNGGQFGGGGSYVSIWRCLPGSDVTATIIITTGAASACVWGLYEITGIDTSGSNGAGAIRASAVSAGGTSPRTATLSGNLISGNARFAAGGADHGSDVPTVSSGTWDTYGTSKTADLQQVRVAWDLDPAVGDKSATWASTGSTLVSVIAEIVFAPPSSGDSVFAGSIPL